MKEVLHFFIFFLEFAPHSDTVPALSRRMRHEKRSSQPKRQIKKTVLNQDHQEIAQKLEKNEKVTGERTTKHSEVTVRDINPDGSGLMESVGVTQQVREQNVNGTLDGIHKVTDVTQTSETPRLIADYGILGNSDDEDSAKWAAEEIQNATLGGKNHERIPETQRLEYVRQDGARVRNQTSTVEYSKVHLSNTNGNMSARQVKSQDSQVVEAVSDIKTADSTETLKGNRNVSSVNETTTSKINSKSKKLGQDVIGSNMNTLAETQFKNGASEGRLKPTTAVKVEVVNEPSLNYKTLKLETSILRSKYQGTPQRASSANYSFVPRLPLQKGAPVEQPAKATDLVTLLGPKRIANTMKSINTTNRIQPHQPTKATDKESSSHSIDSNTSNHYLGREAPSLAVNIMRLRSGQSFDLRMPSTSSVNGSFKDNHFHLPPDETHKAAELATKGVHGKPVSSSFLSDTLNKANAEEQASTRQPNELLKQLNSELLGFQREQFPSKDSPNALGSDYSYGSDRDQMPAGRTFTTDVLRSNNNEILSSRLPNPLQGREEQSEIQQDESLAQALNDSSASSIIFSANKAILDTDKAAFAKKSTRDRLDPKQLDNRSKRTNTGTVHHSTEQVRLNFVTSKGGRHILSRTPAKTQARGTRRQVIDIGNHLIWFGGQNSVDTNGFPRQRTGSHASQYNLMTGEETKADNPNLQIEEAKSKGSGTKTSKGYTALEHALSSMESNLEKQNLVDLSYQDQYGAPSNKAQHTPGQESSVLIQDDAFYQGVFDNVKLNKSNSNESIGSNQSGLQINSKERNNGEPSENFTVGGQKIIRKNRKNEAIVIHTETVLPMTETPKITQKESQEQIDNITITEANQDNSSAGKNLSLLTSQFNGPNLTLGEGGDGQKQANHVQHGQQSQKQKPLLNHHTLKSKHQHDMVTQPQGQSQVHLSEDQLQNEHQPSAFIKKVNKSDGEPETYHVVVNDVGKKITNANGHVTVIISGPTAQQASMIGDNALLIPQTGLPAASSGNFRISSTEGLPKTKANGNKSKGGPSEETGIFGSDQEINSTQQTGTLPKEEDDKLLGAKIPLGIEGKVNKDLNKDKTTQGGNLQPQQRVPHISKTNSNLQGTETLMQLGHSFLNVGQDLTKGTKGLQIQEVSRPEINPAIQEEKKLLQGIGAENLGQGESSLAVQSQDVPTLNLVLNPTHRLDGLLSVGGKVIPLRSGKDGSSYISVTNTPRLQQLDCQPQPRKEQTTVTILTCQKKQSLEQNPQALHEPKHLFGIGSVYSHSTPTRSGGLSQLDQVINLLNDQVKTTINTEMNSESKDIENILTGMYEPSSSLPDTEGLSSESEAPESARRTSPVDTGETDSYAPEFEAPMKWIPPHHTRLFRQHYMMPNFQHPWEPHHHHHRYHPLAFMSHRGNNDGFWDYQHNIWIPRGFSQGKYRENEGEGREDNPEEYNNEEHWRPWSHHGHRRGNWLMAHTPWAEKHPHFSPFTPDDLFHLRLPTLFGRSGPWKPPHNIQPTPQLTKQQLGTKRTAVLHKGIRGDRDLCRPIIEGPSPPLKAEWEYLGKVLCSCRGGLSDSEW